MSELRFGFCVPVFANPGAAFFRTPNWTALDPSAAVDAAIEAERLGYDSIWVADHLMHGFDDALARLQPSAQDGCAQGVVGVLG